MLGVADLSGAHLNWADFSGTFLYGTDLSGADLTSAHDLTQEQIDKAKGDFRGLHTHAR